MYPVITCVCLCCIQLGTKTKLKVGNVKWAGNGGNSVVDTWASTTRQTAHQVSLTYVLSWLLLYYKYATAVTRSLMRWASGRGWAGLSLWDYFGWERVKHTVSREIPIRICLTRKKLGLTSEGTFWKQNKWEIQQQLIHAQGYKQSPWTCLRNRLMFCNEYQPLTLNYNAKQYYLSGRTLKMSYYHEQWTPNNISKPHNLAQKAKKNTALDTRSSSNLIFSLLELETTPLFSHWNKRDPCYNVYLLTLTKSKMKSCACPGHFLQVT